MSWILNRNTHAALKQGFDYSMNIQRGLYNRYRQKLCFDYILYLFNHWQPVRERYRFYNKPEMSIRKY